MSSVVATSLMTTDDLLALPDDGRERWLIRGELREGTMTVRNQFHSLLLINIGFFLKQWNDRQPLPRGKVLGGEAGFRLRQTPDTTVGIDVAYVGPEVASRRTASTTLIDGPPVLAVEILSPSDTQESIHEKIDAYLAAGTKLVWVFDSKYPLVTVYELGKNPTPLSANDTLTGDPHLPGLSIPVAAIFE
jgi:Uma2 family endonuclease